MRPPPQLFLCVLCTPTAHPATCRCAHIHASLLGNCYLCICCILYGHIVASLPLIKRQNPRMQDAQVRHSSVAFGCITRTPRMGGEGGRDAGWKTSLFLSPTSRRRRKGGTSCGRLCVERKNLGAIQRGNNIQSVCRVCSSEPRSGETDRCPTSDTRNSTYTYLPPSER